MKIGILTGGGDVPGLNPCIRSITLNADDLGWEVIGFKRGWQGVLEIDPDDPASVVANSVPLTRDSVRGIDRMGGTILHTSRLDPRTIADGDKTPRCLHTPTARRRCDGHPRRRRHVAFLGAFSRPRVSGHLHPQDDG